MSIGEILFLADDAEDRLHRFGDERGADGRRGQHRLLAAERERARNFVGQPIAGLQCGQALLLETRGIRNWNSTHHDARVAP
jgi:hypothetical protein